MGITALTRPTGIRVSVPRRPLSDERLGELVHRGDDEAFGTLFERYRDPLARYCRSIVDHPEDAGDAQQNTMIAALRALRARPLDGKVKPWLYRIAHNESINVLRRRRDYEPLDEQSPSLDAPEVRLENWEALVADLRSLPERQRGALLLRELAGLDYDEIGTVFAITAVAARKSVFEARAGLAETAAGRGTACGEIRMRISDGDRRALRGRQMTAHLASCPACASFAASIHARREVFSLVPALPASAGVAGGIGVAGYGAGAAATGGLGAASSGLAASGVLSGGALSAAAIKGVAMCALCAIAGSVVLSHQRAATAAHRARPAVHHAGAPTPVAASSRPATHTVAAAASHLTEPVAQRSSARQPTIAGARTSGRTAGSIGSGRSARSGTGAASRSHGPGTNAAPGTSTHHTTSAGGSDAGSGDPTVSPGGSSGPTGSSSGSSGSTASSSGSGSSASGSSPTATRGTTGTGSTATSGAGTASASGGGATASSGAGTASAGGTGATATSGAVSAGPGWWNGSADTSSATADSGGASRTSIPSVTTIVHNATSAAGAAVSAATGGVIPTAVTGPTAATTTNPIAGLLHSILGSQR